MLFRFALITSIVVLADIYFFNATKSLLSNWSGYYWYKWIYISVSVIVLGYFTYGWFAYMNGVEVARSTRMILQGIVFCLFIPKVLAIVVFLFDDIIRLFRLVFQFFQPQLEGASGGISRLKFLQLTGLGVFGFFLSAFFYGIVKGAYSYSVKQVKLPIKNLPQDFVGLKIVQISDLHVGSFFSTAPLEEAVEIINKQEADFVFFTGDLVNEIAEEATDFVPVLKKIESKQGKFSILGNHDYGDYFYRTDDPEYHQKKAHNKDLMKQYHKEAGFRLLLDENVQYELNGKVLSIIGIENWGAKARFPKYGDLKRAYSGTEASALKLLLSHDPSHWEAQVRKDFKDIDVTFSGHTHGMQFGVEIPGFKWSPVKYIYPQWAGLYKQENQSLYVNRGLGFIGYPGRVGISPEITVFELESV